MKTRYTTCILTIVSLLMLCGISLAVEVKTPDIKGAAATTKANVSSDAKATAADARKSAAESKAAVKGKIVDINSATEAELKTVPGIGDAYATKIIAGRPYANKAQLKSRGILTGVVYEQVKDLLIAKQAKKEAAPKKK